MSYKADWTLVYKQRVLRYYASVFSHNLPAYVQMKQPESQG